MMLLLNYKTLVPLCLLATIVPMMFDMRETYIQSSPQAFNESNETTIVMMQSPTETVDFVVGEMDDPTISPSFAPPVVVSTTQCVIDLDYYCVMRAFAEQEVEPAIISLASDLFDAVSTKFELIRGYIEAFIKNNMYYAADLLFDIKNTKNFEHIFDIMDHVNDLLFDSIIITTKFEGFHHFSSAPMVTGNLTGLAINLGRIDDGDSMVFEELIPSTGCTIPVFSLDYILEWTDQEVFVKSPPKKQDESASYFMLEFLARWGAFLESIVGGIRDRILLEYQRVAETLESYYNEYFAAATPPPPSSWVGQLFISACKKLEALVADFFAPPPPPPRNFQIFAIKSLNSLPIACILLTWHHDAINRNRGGIR